jgi:ubiquinone/menaquinone biosynthesis C-methylase UbiE
VFTHSAQYYDAIYLNMGKDYAAEAELVHRLIGKHKHSAGNTLLDVACGTGIHLEALGKYYQVEGLDLDEGMLAEARRKFPALPLHHGDMLDFDLGRRFDIITCLFSSIGYVQTPERLRQAVSNMGRHLLPGGVLLVEPWFTPDTWQTGYLHALLVDQPELKIARMSLSERKGDLSFFTFHYMVATPQGVEHFSELHELGLFTHAEYLEAFSSAGLEVVHDPQGLDGRGLYAGIKGAD